MLRPPAGAPNVLIVLIDDVGFGASSAFGGPCNTPVADRLAGERAEAQPLPHHGAVLADAPGAAHRAQPPLGRDGRDHRDRHVGAGLQQHPAQGQGADRGDVAAQRLFDGAVRQVPRGAGVGGHARWARSTSGRPGRGSSTSTGSSAARPTSTTLASTRAPRAVEPEKTPEEGYHPHRGPRRPGDHLGAPAEGADAGQAVLHVLRARRHPRAAPRAAGVVGQVQGQVRRRLGRAARADPRAAEEARRGARGRRADRAARRDPGLGRHARRAQAGAGPSDGDLRGLPRADRPRDRPAGRRDRRPRGARRHA